MKRGGDLFPRAALKFQVFQPLRRCGVQHLFVCAELLGKHVEVSGVAPEKIFAALESRFEDHRMFARGVVEFIEEPRFAA